MKTDELFKSISRILGTRLTGENFRSKIKEISSTRGMTSKDRNDIIIEILACLVEMDKHETNI